jgi:microcystin-dependent protein
MSEPFLAEIKMVGFNFAPRRWAFCDGQILPINQNQSLYSLLGTTYGGDGRTTFALPGLRGRTPIHVGQDGGASHTLGSKGGEESHFLSVAEMPAHDHVAQASTNDATLGNPAGGTGAGNNVLAKANIDMYRQHDATTQTDLNAGMIGTVGGQPHNNMQPYLAVNFCIALQGLFPSRN